MPASPIPNNPPEVSAPFLDSLTGAPTYDTTIFAGSLVEFVIDGIDNDLYNGNTPQELVMEVSGGQFADDYQTVTNCLNPPCATFNKCKAVFVIINRNFGGKLSNRICAVDNVNALERNFPVTFFDLAM